MAAAQVTLDALDPSNSSKNTLKLENTEKRDTLITQEKRYQKIWADGRIFEADAPSVKDVPFNSISPADLRKQQPKFFGTMAYPYMNGTLHVGHSFTVSKIEFAASVKRMQGRRVLYPQGYHCTGMPIKACADKLVKEIELFGKNFEDCPETAVTNGAPNGDSQPAPTQETSEDVTKFAAKKGKVAAKSVKLKYQFQIMLAIGIPVEQIHLFADPQYWLHYFPPLCKRDLTNLGCKIDWRRSMVTTPANPYYDAFVRWQMNRLKDLGKIKFGKRHTIYSPKDGQPCLDHDRSEGEGVGVQEYTAMKLKVKEWPESAQQKLDGKLPQGAKIYFVPATLRPETMYGQTCCFVGPKITYGIFQASENEYYFISERAARNMSFQGITSEWGKYPQVAELQGSDVIGTIVVAPLSVYTDGIRILPMETVKATKGTGVVSCVPSDSPDDYATIMDLAKKPEYYGIQKEWVLEVVPVIRTEKYGEITAKTLVEQKKINSPKDAKLLAEAKEEAYKEGFYRGVMIIGDFKGEAVMEAKNKVREQLISAGDAFSYAEPDGHVMSRSGDECVAAHLNQWYLNYGTAENGGDGEWCNTVLDWVHSDGVNTFSNEAKNAFEQVLGWLSQWACARSFGLGTKLPWDPQFIVESLSDSTIYMSYYTIAHLLHKDNFGNEMGPANVKAEQMTDQVWDYVFGRTKDVDTDIPKETLEVMQREFSYWYPLDLRVSGKDLIGNHLTFLLYVHLAIFPQESWPRGIRVNGHLLLNGEKMSKSTGNFLTLSEATAKFGADATRVTLADGGDGMDDANFDETVANSTILRLYELRKWCEEMLKEAHLVETAEQYAQARDTQRIKNTDVIQRSGAKVFWDDVFENEMNGLVQETVAHYDSSSYKLALKSGLYDFIAARDFYREATKAAGIGMHADLIRQYISLQALLLNPVAPHWAEYIHIDVLGNSQSIHHSAFPSVPNPNPSLTAARDYVRGTSSSILSTEGAQVKKLAKGKTTAFDIKKNKKLTVFAASQFPAWQDRCVDLLREAFDATHLSIDLKSVQSKLDKSETKRAMPFVNALKRRLEGGEEPASVFERKLAFDELEVLREMAAGLRQTVQKCVVVEIVAVDQGGKSGEVVAGLGEGVKVGEKRDSLPQPAEGAVPGSPAFFFENV